MTDPRPLVQALIAALQSRGDPALVGAAFHPDAVVFRQGWGLRFGNVDERFDGPGAIAQWMERSPEGVAFFQDSEPEPTPDGCSLRYRVTVAGFENRGTWRLALEGDRIRALWHQPDNLPGMPVAEPAEHHHHHHE